MTTTAPKFTHIFVPELMGSDNVRGALIPLRNARRALKRPEVRAFGFKLVDMNRCEPVIRTNTNGQRWRDLGLKGWSYGHVQHGHVCAGAGGLNSLPLFPL